MDKLVTAVDSIIKDTDNKYDECLVEHFQVYIQSLEDPIKIADRLKSYTEHKSFLMLNQTRAFKTYLSIFKTGNVRFQELESHMDSLWTSLDTIVLNSNLPAATSILSLFEYLMQFSSESSHWLINKKIDPPLKCGVENVVSLSRFYMDCNNYHTRNKAEKLFRALMFASVSMNLTKSHPQIIEIGENVKQLILSGSSFMINLLYEVLSKRDEESQNLEELTWNLYSDYTQESLKTRFKQSLEENNRNINNIVKCLARTNPSEADRVEIILDLKYKRRLLAFVTFSSHVDQPFKFKYILYSIVASCFKQRYYDMVGLDCYRAKCFMKRLEVSSPDQCFMDDLSLDEKVMTSIFAQLEEVIEDDALVKDNLKDIIEALIIYLDKKYKDNSVYKNVMYCCDFLLKLINRNPLEQENIALSLIDENNTLPRIIYGASSTKDILKRTKPIVQRLLELLQLILKFVPSSEDCFSPVEVAKLCLRESKQLIENPDLLYPIDHCESPTESIDKINMESIIDDIINFDLKSDGISDCY